MLKSILLIITTLFTTQALAHPDHSLDQTAHAFYHAIFWIAFAAVVVKGISWWKSRQQQIKDAKQK